MELKLSKGRMLIMLAAIATVLALVLSTALAGAQAATTHHRHAAHHAHHAAAAGTEATTPEGENSGVDPDGPGGPDVGGDHQCPPTCSSGEQG
jgi:hypothetical protein